MKTAKRLRNAAQALQIAARLTKAAQADVRIVLKQIEAEKAAERPEVKS